MITPKDAAATVMQATSIACQKINEFSNSVLKTRGGRLGSGMGGLLEALWGYYINSTLSNEGGKAAECEISWLSDHEYNDFACIYRDKPWTPSTKEGELFRIEAKSMNVGVDESKGHFDEISIHLNQWDLLVVLVWSWEYIDKVRVSPRIKDFFIGPAKDVAYLRDQLHLARGGTFVDKFNCPDKCKPDECRHHGEPLNANKKRERLSGPKTTRPSANVAYAANFGGLVRMLKTDSERARTIFRKVRKENDVAHEFISFIHRNFVNEEKNQYTFDEWKNIAKAAKIDTTGKSKMELIDQVKLLLPDYQDKLRNLYP